uniref:Uncharacterized protein n=1 Tax=Spongospora subterranea TaxID=70186 RepID=A0A0H5QZC6_9EUKA|eukprot:CRZ07310.1 hypothetical protein [Spongospora subterranea]
MVKNGASPNSIFFFLNGEVLRAILQRTNTLLFVTNLLCLKILQEEKENEWGNTQTRCTQRKKGAKMASTMHSNCRNTGTSGRSILCYHNIQIPDIIFQTSSVVSISSPAYISSRI